MEQGIIPWDDNLLNSGEQTSQSDEEARLRGEIGGAWDAYIQSLGTLEGDIVNSKSAQMNTVNTNLEHNNQLVNNQSASSLKDLHNQMRNAFQAGNTQLGAFGAGDSSAANMYGYAINRQGLRQAGDLQTQTRNALMENKYQADNALNGIAQWFSEKQIQLKQMIAEGSLNKAKDIAALSKSFLDQAIAQANAVTQNRTNRENAIIEWATANSTNMAQLSQNISQIPGIISQINGTFTTPKGGYVPNTQQKEKEKNSLFG
jgi:hypothetical protein